MNVGQLKALLQDIPDDALVLVEGRHGTVVLAEVSEGNCTEPNSQGFCNYIPDGEAPEWYNKQAIFFYRPM